VYPSRIYFVRLLSPTLGRVIQITERSECAVRRISRVVNKGFTLFL